MRTRGKGAENLRGVPVDGGYSKGGTDKKGAQPKAADILKKSCTKKVEKKRKTNDIVIFLKFYF